MVGPSSSPPPPPSLLLCSSSVPSPPVLPTATQQNTGNEWLRAALYKRFILSVLGRLRVPLVPLLVVSDADNKQSQERKKKRTLNGGERTDIAESSSWELLIQVFRV